jgi:hypothetical protein
MKMKKWLLVIACMQITALFAEVLWEASAPRDFEGRYAKLNSDGSFTVERLCWLTGKKIFPVDTTKSYRISCEVKSIDKNIAGNVRVGVMPRNAKKTGAAVSGLKPVSGTEAQVVSLVTATDKVIKVDDASKWKKVASRIVYDADPSGQLRDLPNFDFVKARPVSWEKKGDIWEIKLARPAGVELSAGTVIRQHYDGRNAIFSNAKKLSTEWQKMEFVIVPGVSTDGAQNNKFFTGVAYAAPMLALPGKVCVRNFKYEIVE